MTQENILMLGIGNLLWADEGFGVRAVQALHRQWRFPGQVTLMDGGTQGLNLLPHVQEAHKLIVFDAIDYGLPPGTLRMLANEEVPRFMGAKKLSLHQTGFQEVLAIAELTGSLPDELVLIGVQPEDYEDFGGNLRAVVGAQIQPALEAALACLRRWGVKPEQREGEPGTVEPLLPASLDVDFFGATHSGATAMPSPLKTA
ncbi:HyaD/HybD family hydrogenase maturation endopeptidase [Candidatus Ferrigenium straubiae]|uniref:HyaD/HybD family hydrogenase maturation endopeptidase n=1 Tax=Candidatus Ferrigenium straubiae TaxID=2919506 RepID=UPI003F4AF391